MMPQQTAPSAGSVRPSVAVHLPVAGVPLNVVLFGPPGAGKGTQADRFCARHHLPKISTGDMLRQAVQHGTELGAVVRDTLQRGALVNDELMIRVVQQRLQLPDTANGFVLDGFPRTVGQAEALGTILTGRGPIVVFAFDVNTEVLVRRLSTRQRFDDTQQVIRERLRVYAEDTKPVLDYYRRHGMVTVLDGDRSPDVVSAAIEAIIARSSQRDTVV